MATGAATESAPLRMPEESRLIAAAAALKVVSTPLASVPPAPRVVVGVGVGVGVGLVLAFLAFGSGLTSAFGRESSMAFYGVTMMSPLFSGPRRASAPTSASAQLWPRRRQEQFASKLVRYFSALGLST